MRGESRGDQGPLPITHKHIQMHVHRHTGRYVHTCKHRCMHTPINVYTHTCNTPTVAKHKGVCVWVCIYTPSTHRDTSPWMVPDPTDDTRPPDDTREPGRRSGPGGWSRTVGYIHMKHV